MNSIRKSKLNIIFSLIYQIVAIILGLLIPRITIVLYGSNVNGLLSSATQFVRYLIVFEAGIQLLATKSLYKTVGCDDKAGTNEILSAVNKNYKKIGVYYFIGLVALSAIFPLVTKEENLKYFTVFFVVLFSGMSNVVLFFFQGKYRILLQVEGKNYFINLINIITNIFSQAVRIVLLYFKVNIAIVVLGTFIVSMLPATIIMIYIKKKYKWIDLNVKPNFSALKQTKETIVHQVAGLIFSNTDTLILTIFCGLKAVSVYVIYKMIYDYMLSFAQIPLDGMSFRLGQLYSNDREKFKEYISSVELFSSNLCFILFTVTLCLTSAFVGLYTKGVEDINYVDEKLALLFAAMQLLNCMRKPKLYTINYAGHFKQTLIPTIIETGINIVVSIIGVLLWGIYGVLLGTIAALTYRTIDVIIYSNKKLLKRSPLRTFSYYLVEGLLLGGIYLLFNSFNIAIDSYFKFILVGLILIVIVGVIFVSISCLLFQREFVFLKSKILKKNLN